MPRKPVKKAPAKRAPKVREHSSQELTEQVSNIAKLATKAEQRSIGILNVGPDFWFWRRDGAQVLIKRHSKMIVDQASFESDIQPREGYKKGHLLVDQSLLSSTDIPGEVKERPLNALFDHEIESLVKNEDKCIAFVDRLTSVLTIDRIREAAVKALGKRKSANILMACDQRVFVVSHNLPEDYEKMDNRKLRALVEERLWPDGLKPDQDEAPDEVRERINAYLEGEPA